MMKKTDILELKKRFTKNGCTITRMCGCYVDAHKNQVVKIGETFLNLEDDEFFKYLEIAKKTLSGTIGNQLLNLEFPTSEESNGGHQQFFMGLKASGLKNEELLDVFYQMVIDHYDYTGNYLILLFHDAYDVIKKTKDKLNLDESEEVFEYLLCSICPVTLAKPGLGYLEKENRIGVRVRDWIVGAPENGFLFPAFSDRSSDIHSLLYFTKNTLEPHNSFMEAGLGVLPKRTAAEKKEVFHSIVKSALNESHLEEGVQAEDVLLEMHESLSSMIEEQDAIYEKDRPEIPLTKQAIKEIFAENGISDEVTAKIEQSLTEEFQDDLPTAETVVDQKAVNAHIQKKKEKQLVKQVETLKQKLSDTQNELEEKEATITRYEDSNLALTSPNNEESPNEHLQYDIVVRVKPQKVSGIHSQMMDGKRYLLIPIDDYEKMNINGVETDFS